VVALGKTRTLKGGEFWQIKQRQGGRFLEKLFTGGEKKKVRTGGAKVVKSSKKKGGGGAGPNQMWGFPKFWEKAPRGGREIMGSPSVV